MTYINCKESEKALKCFDKADQIDPKLPLQKFQKGNLLMHMEKFSEKERAERALKEFQDLARLVPRETPVHIMIGKCHKILGNKDMALKSFKVALDLDPKDTNMVKNLIEKIH